MFTTAPMGCTLLQLNTGGILLRYVNRRRTLEGDTEEVLEEEGWERFGKWDSQCGMTWIK